jgi:hypothetical protein
MKKMIEELKNMYQKWVIGEQMNNNMLEKTIMCLLAVMERIDAMEQPPKVAWVESVGDAEKYVVPNAENVFPFGFTKEQIDAFMATGKPPITDEQRKAIDRAAMIKALRWACRAEGIIFGEACSVQTAITRLENGGEL